MSSNTQPIIRVGGGIVYMGNYIAMCLDSDFILFILTFAFQGSPLKQG